MYVRAGADRDAVSAAARAPKNQIQFETAFSEQIVPGAGPGVKETHGDVEGVDGLSATRALPGLLLSPAYQPRTNSSTTTRPIPVT
eukprot:250554-Rhodomonas_salina.1